VHRRAPAALRPRFDALDVWLAAGTGGKNAKPEDAELKRKAEHSGLFAQFQDSIDVSRADSRLSPMSLLATMRRLGVFGGHSPVRLAFISSSNVAFPERFS
jgi:hypothetical protein